MYSTGARRPGISLPTHAVAMSGEGGLQWWMILVFIMAVLAIACCLCVIWCKFRPAPPKAEPPPPPPPKTPLERYRNLQRQRSLREDKEQLSPLTGSHPAGLHRAHRPPPLFIRQHSVNLDETGNHSPHASSPPITRQLQRKRSLSESDSGYRSRAFTFPSSASPLTRPQPPNFQRQTSRVSQQSQRSQPKSAPAPFTMVGF